MIERATSVRPATPDDAPRIGTIHVDGWRAAYRDLMPASYLATLSAEKRAAGWAHAIGKDPRSVLVIEGERAILGWVALGQSRDPLSDTGEIFALYVDPSSWRLGCGQSLLAAAEAKLWARGHRTSTLWVLEKNLPALAFYHRFGYFSDGGQKIEVVGGVELAELRLAKRRPPGDLAAGRTPDARP